MKKIRVILPVLAIVFAIGAAFSTNATPKPIAKLKVSIQGGICEQDGFCTEGGSSVCQYTATSPAQPVDLFNTGSPSPACNSYSGNGTWSVE